jgi:hypothetical protein
LTIRYVLNKNLAILNTDIPLQTLVFKVFLVDYIEEILIVQISINKLTLSNYDNRKI